MRILWILRLAVALATLAVGGTLFAQGTSPGGPPYRIIVNDSNPVDSVERRFLADAFLKKVTVWSSGEVIRPVDLPPNSPIRRKFSDDVMKRSVEAVKSYWQQHIFAGHDLPPPELSTEDDVIAYVVKHPGAVGYVSASADLHGAKAVALR
jgi:ABC-type phosphate transport system substrate-binding protein